MCDVYWPESHGKVCQFDDLVVAFVGEKRSNGFYWVREFEMIRNGEKRKITQYHAVGWPDRKEPKTEFLNEFLE